MHIHTDRNGHVVSLKRSRHGHISIIGTFKIAFFLVSSGGNKILLIADFLD